MEEKKMKKLFNRIMGRKTAEIVGLILMAATGLYLFGVVFVASVEFLDDILNYAIYPDLEEVVNFGILWFATACTGIVCKENFESSWIGIKYRNWLSETNKEEAES
jgi:hypothetical protein